VVHGLLAINGEMIMIEAEWPTLPSRAPTPDGSSPVVVETTAEERDERWSELAGDE
jgi:PhnB protein